jgi:dihydrofolate reductase
VEKDMSVKAIVAIDLEGGIGAAGTMPWPKNSNDMRWFRQHTVGHIVVMGRTTWQSIGNTKLRDRFNVVISSNPDNVDGNPDLIINPADFSDAKQLIRKIRRAAPGKHVWIIGGAQTYSYFLDVCEEFYVTEFPKAYGCDTLLDSSFFKDFELTSVSEAFVVDGTETYNIYVRKAQ